MIETLSKEILDTAYYGFMYEEDYPVTEARFSNNNLKLLSIAIRKMFGLLNIEKDLSVLDKIHVFRNRSCRKNLKTRLMYCDLLSE